MRLIARVMRWGCEKISQIFVQIIMYLTFFVGKVPSYFCNLKTAQSKQSPDRRKFAQSGHPADHTDLDNLLLFVESQLQIFDVKLEQV
jgi:hypothetical protein